MHHDHDDVPNPLGLDITDEDRAMAAAMRHVPDREELQDLLTRYYHSPITKGFIDRVEGSFKEILSTPGWERPYHDHFASPTQWRGSAWNEGFSGNRRSMTPSDLALMLAHMIAKSDSSFPQPKLYCPEPFIGIWQQLEPKPVISEPCLWRMAVDGAFQTNSPDIPAQQRYWCVMRGHDNLGDELVLYAKPYRGPWGISCIVPTADELAGVHRGYIDRIQIRLRRVPEYDTKQEG